MIIECFYFQMSPVFFRSFDRERTASYSFEVTAMDGGLYGPRKANVKVDIIISDVNDNAPKFEQVPYRAAIPLDHHSGREVVQVCSELMSEKVFLCKEAPASRKIDTIKEFQ